MKNLFVGNMNFQTTESDLNELFKPFGQVARVHVPIDRETGRSRGFAFVEMPNDEEAARPIAGLDRKHVGGGRGRGGFSNEDCREAPRQPRW
jgi:cold-inducible RNA-binding protein